MRLNPFRPTEHLFALCWKFRLTACFGTARSTTLVAQVKKQTRSVPTGRLLSTRPWTFPQPPPPPSTEELHECGLPLLKQAASHAAEGRILLSGWKHEENNCVEIASYHDVLTQAGLVSSFIYKRKDTFEEKSTIIRDYTTSKIDDKAQNYTSTRPRLIAHLNVPSWDYVATQYGIWGAGYGSVPLALSQKVPEIEHVLRDSDPHHIIIGGNCRLPRNTTTSQPDAGTNLPATHSPQNTADLWQAAENLGMRDRIVKLSDILHQEHPTESSQSRYWLGNNGIVSSLEDPALVLYTSGTTSLPKGTLITHRNIYHQVTDLVAAWEWDKSDVAVHVLPLHHVHGVVNLLSCAAYVGARLEFQPFNAEALWRQWATVKSESTNSGTTLPTSTQENLPKPNLFMAVPTIYAKLLEAADNLSKEIVTAAVSNTLRPMRLMVSGSAALPVSVLHQWRELTGHTLLERYGMTEIAMALSNPYREDRGDQEETEEKSTQPEIEKSRCIRRPGYVGLPLPSVQVRLVNPDTNEVVDSPGMSGELQVKGPTVFQRYLNRDDATLEAFTKDGYFRTGDIAQYDGGLVQSYRILGRASVDIIKMGGHKLSALEIERELLEHPDIAEVAVLGMPDDVWGERVAAICRMKPNREVVTVDGLRRFCSDKMSKEKIPSRLMIVSDIPKNAMGKINKKNLAALLPSAV